MKLMKYNHKSLICAALVALLSAPLGAQHAYTLEECRTMALKSNLAVRNAANEVESAQQTRKEAFTNYFPNLSASGMGFNANKGLLQMDLAPGMSMSLMKNGIMGGVTVTQPVFAGGQIVNGNRLADVGLEASRVQQEQSELEVRLTVEQYYWQVVTLQEKLRTLSTVENQLAVIKHDVESAVDAGVTTRNDLLQVQLKVNDIASSRINLQKNLTVCRRLLAQYIGLGTDTIAVASEIAIGEVPPFPSHLYCDHSQALTATISYRLLQSNVKANRCSTRWLWARICPLWQEEQGICATI